MIMNSNSYCLYLVGVFVVFVVVGNFGRSAAVPRALPQFLPVAVQLDYPPPPFVRKPTKQINNNDNFIYEISNNKQKLIPPKSGLQSIENDEGKKKIIKNELAPIEESSSLHSENSRTKDQQKLNKSKESKKIILNQNSNWILKTINNQPAHEVLMTDKASQARDLKDSTESSLVKVRKLDEISYK